ncbi:hypothetical protein Klosneuvirus_1_127 [Klosneuvirus KNV1]|uniref:Thioredoxin n=1 Tax=Klosneuvirus KNV1 TaxID=1977640 RepID=A0A1V0SHR9_9VIRU|nr:hypothetical protein Klosneuvirus_1_127 [Klosneuvirus KNV1]
MNTNTLFFSYNCETCKRLIMLLRNENLLGFFKMVCVDDKLNQMPKNMIVPTMMVVNLNKPLVAHETFQWVEQMKFIRQQQVMDINKKIIQQYNTNNPNQQKGPFGYSEEMMAGYSDKFAFTKSDNALPHSYVNLNDEDKNAIFTAPQEKHRISKPEQQKVIKEIEERRNTQDTEYQSFMKQKQIEFVMQAEHEKLLQQQNRNN